MKNLINKEAVYLYNKGRYYHSYNILGAHNIKHDGKRGIRFAVWAPNAKKVSVVGDFNRWNGHKMDKLGNSGIWVCFIEGLIDKVAYKYKILTEEGQYKYKSDPFAFYSELRPHTASIVYNLNHYKWHDEKWLEHRKNINVFEQPINIYEMHLGSWKRKKDGETYTYRELADLVIGYVKEMGYTHIELLPIMEHPFDGSWGYQITGFYSITSRYGTPKDFMYFVDRCHQNGIGVILDWVPGHFCMDEHGLCEFDGKNIYGCIGHKHWGTMNFDFSKTEVHSYLISNAVFWFDKFHIDGLRIDGVSSMLYLDYGYEDKSKAPRNKYGGNSNIDAIAFMQKLNEIIFKYYPFALMIAEESSSWSLVTKPQYMDGLGYNFKWDMGWMNDTLRYMQLDPFFRKYNHNLITFSMSYAFAENFILSLSHDEVVHGKKSLVDKMPGDYWSKFANYRVLIAYMMFHPGKKLLFMGSEIAQFIEWREYAELDWMLLEYDMHKKFQKYVKDINHYYLKDNALWQIDYDWSGFQWIDADNKDQSIFIFKRVGKKGEDFNIIILNFTPVYYKNFRVGVPVKGIYTTVFNSDEEKYGGSDTTIKKTMKAKELVWHNQPYSVELTVPPLSSLVIKLSRRKFVTET